MEDYINKEYTEIDYLDEDDPITGQKFACLSFLSPEGILNCKIRGLKVRGVYNTREEADARAKYLQSVDPNFNVFVGPVGYWLPWDPDPNDKNSVQDQIYKEKQLNKLMKGYKDNLAQSTQVQHQRKQEIIRKAAIQEKSRRDIQIDKCRKEHEKRKKDRMIDEIIDQQLDSTSSKRKRKSRKRRQKKKAQYDKIENEIKAEEKLVDKERERLNNNEKVIKNEESKLQDDVESYDQQILQIKKLYENLGCE